MSSDPPIIEPVATPGLTGSFAVEESHLATILDTVASLVLVLDREGRIVLFNRTCERVTGYTFAEVRGRHPWDLFIPPEDAPRVQAVFGRLRAGQTNSYDNVWLTKDGRVREIAWTNTVLGDGSGEVRWVVPTGIDITERRAAERRLVESEQRYRALFEDANDAIFVCDGRPGADFRILEANDLACRRLGCSREELLALRMPDIHTAEEWEACSDAAARLQVTGDIIFETTERRRNGSVLPVEVSAHRIDLDGRTAIIATSRDLSERKRLEAQVAQSSKLEAIGRLAGGVAHDFNNLLVVILGQADAVREALPQGSPLREDVEEILQAGRKAAALTQQLLAFGRKAVVRPVVLDVNAIVGEMAKLLQRLVGENVLIHLDLSPNPCPVLADAAGIQQIIVNLVVNARDAMPSGGRITIRTEFTDAATGGLPVGRYVLISVQDTGVGIDDDVRQRIFEPFFTTKEDGRGTGLGLATVFGTVKQAGGHVLVESAPGAGACFKVFLPQTTQVPEVAPAAPRPARAPGDGRTVLVVEDDPAVLGITIRILEDDGYRVLPTSDPREAVTIASNPGQRIDALLSDVIMPHLNGRELAERVRVLRPGIALAYMSGYTGDVIGRSGVLDPSVRFVSKPFARADLLDTVAGALADRARAAQLPLAAVTEAG